MQEESTRRKVNSGFDAHPSQMQKFNYQFSKPYLSNKSVLDIGCFTGQFEAQALGVASKVIGVDPNINAINFAKERLPKCKFYIASADRLPFAGSSFDLTVFFDVIEHLEKATEPICLKEIHRILKPNGIFIMSTPNSNFLSILMDPAFFLLGHRHYSLNHLLKLLRKSNFKVLKTRSVGKIFHLISNNINLLEKHILHKKISSLDYILEKEYQKNGFASNYIISQKI